MATPGLSSPISNSKVSVATGDLQEKPPVTTASGVDSPDTTTEDPFHEVPDGGLKAWLTVAGGWITLFTTFGSSNSFGVFQDFYTLAGSSSASNISWIGSMQIFLMFSMGLVSGKLFDMGYFHYVHSVGIVIYLVSTFMLSLADYRQYYQIFLAQGLGIGIGIGCMFVPSLAIQGHYWKKRRALAMGLVMTGTSAGGIVYPIMMNQLLHHSTLGFAWSVRAMGFMDLGLLIIAKLIMTPNHPPKRASAPKPDMRAIIMDKPYIIAVAGGFFVLFGLFFPCKSTDQHPSFFISDNVLLDFYLQLYINLKGLDPTLAFYSLAILNAASIPGRTLPNLFADKYGQFNMIVPMSFCTGILLFSIFGVNDTASVIVFAILYGFFSGAFVSLVPPIMAVLAKDVSEIGVRMGIAFFITGFANLTGAPINGALVKPFPPYPWYKPITFSGCAVMLGTVFLFIARQLLAKRRGTQLV